MGPLRVSFRTVRDTLLRTASKCGANLTRHLEEEAGEIRTRGASSPEEATSPQIARHKLPHTIRRRQLQRRRRRRARGVGKQDPARKRPRRLACDAQGRPEKVRVWQEAEAEAEAVGMR